METTTTFAPNTADIAHHERNSYAHQVPLNPLDVLARPGLFANGYAPNPFPGNGLFPGQSQLPMMHGNMFNGFNGLSGLPSYLTEYDISSQVPVSPKTLPTQMVLSGSVSDTNLVAMKRNSIASTANSSSQLSSRPQSSAFSRRSDGSTGSPSKTSNDSVLFCRTANPGGRQRTSQACEKCRDRKTKCTGTRPVCKRCADRGLTCEWAPETRVRGPQKHRRLDVEDANIGESKRSLHLPVSDSSELATPTPLAVSTKIHASASMRSAPPIQSAFPPFDKPGKLLGKPDPKRASWPDDALRSAAIATAIHKGDDAMKVMGVEVKTISPSDDCWDSVRDAPLETPGLVPDSDQSSCKSEYFPLVYRNNVNSVESSSPSASHSQRTASTTASENERVAAQLGLAAPQILAPVASRISALSFDPTGDLNAGMLRLLDFSAANPNAVPSNGLFSGAGTGGVLPHSDSTFSFPSHDFAEAIKDNSGGFVDDQTTPMPISRAAFPSQVPSQEDELIAQYFNQDFFSSQPPQSQL